MLKTVGAVGGWLASQARELMLSALGIRDDMRAWRRAKPEIEEMCRARGEKGDADVLAWVKDGSDKQTGRRVLLDALSCIVCGRQHNGRPCGQHMIRRPLLAGDGYSATDPFEADCLAARAQDEANARELQSIRDDMQAREEAKATEFAAAKKCTGEPGCPGCPR
jgi:hypothetical protein